MSNEKRIMGRCFCGAVEISVAGSPAAMGYCHCASCRHWSASPINAFTLWAPDAVKVTRGAELVASYKKTDNSERCWCKACGGHLFTRHPAWQLIDVYAAIIPDFQFSPMVHVNYAEAVLHIHDGLVKQSDLPPEMGGSGRLLAE